MKERGLCHKYSQKIMETTHRLNYLLPCQRCHKYDVRRFNKYPLKRHVIHCICKNRITYEIYTLCMYHVAYHVTYHVASHFDCLVFNMLVCSVYMWIQLGGVAIKLVFVVVIIIAGNNWRWSTRTWYVGGKLCMTYATCGAKCLLLVVKPNRETERCRYTYDSEMRWDYNEEEK